MAFAEPINQTIDIRPVDGDESGDSGCLLGIDPGIQRTGYAVLTRGETEANPFSRRETPRLAEGGVIRSDADETMARRVAEIASGIREVVEQYRPRAAAIEQLFAHPQHPRAALVMAHARGAILLVLAEAEVPVLDFAPTQIKQILTGSGRASKEQMQHAVTTELGLDRLLEPNDVADATAAALCLYHSVRFA